MEQILSRIADALERIADAVTPKVEPLVKDTLDAAPLIESQETLPLFTQGEIAVNPKKKIFPYGSRKWSAEEENKIVTLRNYGFSTFEIATKCHRTQRAIEDRLVLIARRKEVM